MAKKEGDSITIRRIDDAPRPTMKAKQTWYVDADGKPTLDASKAAQQLTEKGIEILPHIVAEYGFQDGDLATKAIKQVAADTETAEKAVAKERRAAEKAAAEGLGNAPDQLSADRQAEVKGQSPTENKAVEKGDAKK